MISERELIEAIEKCEREPVTQSKIAMLADFYIVYDHVFGEKFDSMYSERSDPIEVIQTDGNSDFLRLVNGKNAEAVMAVMDELMEATKMLHPRMYEGVLRKIEEI